MKKLAALALVPAAVAVLAVPAGAASTQPKAVWSHQSLPCATGHKSATVVYRESAHMKGWYDNPCPRQWLSITWAYPGSETNGSSFDVAPHHKGEMDGVYMNGTLVTPGH